MTITLAETTLSRILTDHPLDLVITLEWDKMTSYSVATYEERRDSANLSDMPRTLVRRTHYGQSPIKASRAFANKVQREIRKVTA